MAKLRINSFLTDIESDAQREALQGITYYWDPVCGIYALGDELKDRLEQNLPDKRKVAYALATRSTRGMKHTIFVADSPEVSAALAPQMPKWTFVTAEELIRETPSSALDMLDAALYNLGRQLNHPSEIARVAPHDCWRLLAYNSSSLTYVIEQLCGIGYIKDKGADPLTSYSTRRFEIQSHGWEKIASMQTVHNAVKRQAFVAMWFDPQMEPFYLNGIRPAVEEDGTKCIRIDLKEHNNKICDEIIAEIRRSKYVIADFSGERGGVYFEAGFAFGLSRPVIWTVRKSDLAKVHFDTRQYNHLVYETAEELRQKLSNRIKATIT